VPALNAAVAELAELPFAGSAGRRGGPVHGGALPESVRGVVDGAAAGQIAGTAEIDPAGQDPTRRATARLGSPSTR